MIWTTRIPKAINHYRLRHRPNICFIWVPKACGTSIFRWLAQELGMLKLKNRREVQGCFPQAGPVTFGHMSYSQLLESKLVRECYHDSAFKFAFVRNPFDRALSLYYYLRTKEHIARHLTFVDWLRTIKRGVEPVGLYNQEGLSQCNPQASWIYDKDGQSMVDFIGYAENFTDGISNLADRLGIPRRYYHENRTPRANGIKELYESLEAVELVRDIYARDFEAFSYSTAVPS